MKDLYQVMIDMADRYRISVPQVAMAFCSTKGIVPICGCRKPKQIEELAAASRITLTADEISLLEETADKANAKIMGADIFRPFVKKARK